MTRIRMALGALALGLVIAALVAVVAGRGARARRAESAAAIAPATAPPPRASDTTSAPAKNAAAAFLHGRVTTHVGDVYEGRLRWGRNEEAFWGDYFNGFRDETPWTALAPVEQRPKERRAFEIFGLQVGPVKRDASAGRPFMARFGDIARIETHGGHVRVTLKSGTTFDLSRFEASDFDDGVRVWDAHRGVVDLDSLTIDAIEFLPSVEPEAVPERLHGTVRTPDGEFTGFIQWNRTACVDSDELAGHAPEGELSLRFGDMRSIARRSADGCLVTLLDGREIELSGTSDTGPGHRGIYVDDRRYGRVLVSWDVFERIDFGDTGIGPAYDDFPQGHALTGSVTTRDGRRLAGRLVYDLDESETTETLDAPRDGVDYTLPLGMVASIVPPGPNDPDDAHALVTLHDGTELKLEPAGDLGSRNAGVLVFGDGATNPDHVRWIDIERIDFERPTEMDPPHLAR